MYVSSLEHNNATAALMNNGLNALGESNPQACYQTVLSCILWGKTPMLERVNSCLHTSSYLNHYLESELVFAHVI